MRARMCVCARERNLEVTIHGSACLLTYLLTYLGGDNVRAGLLTSYTYLLTYLGGDDVRVGVGRRAAVLEVATAL